MKRRCRILTRKRSLSKWLEMLSRMLDVYVKGALLNVLLMLVYRLDTFIGDEGFYIGTVIIWTIAAIKALCTVFKFMKSASEKVSILNGEYLFSKDVKSNKKNLKKSVAMLMLLIVFKVNAIIVGISVCVLCCNFITLKNSEKYQTYFNGVRGA